MDLNQSIEFNLSSTSSPQLHNFMPMSSFLLPNYNHTTKQVLKQNLDNFWNRQLWKIQNISAFKSRHQLPLARIKRVMKTNREVKMISADTPILLSKACELFILELTLRSWLQTQECKRQMLQRFDIARAIRLVDTLDFLVELVSFDHHNKDDETGNCGEDVEPLSAVQVPVPMIDINEDLVLTDQEIAP
ncbi:nuclear transcription factor Y subunit C-1 isoform X2 [Manihot esculenta]|uniref:Uncharacterized protein n=1 Tax=Manihot esculenta TaxID=3983 RepID=A0ACB7IC69_MANES|nr:nuclear transcription factor Y subunit C-1 isoform X2 [Manihot esculenta]KAG8662502.1 hypothetical protein MANES_01G113300v8 [Manihot esculenta]